MSIRDVLRHAASTGEILRVVYHGGTQPGAVREIHPETVSDTEVVARDLESGISKTFLLAKLEIAADNISAPEYQAEDRGDEGPGSIKRFFADRASEFTDLGWHVELSEDAISLHGFFRNGKIRKTAPVGITYDPFVVELYDDFDGRGLQEERHPSKTPYRVFSSRWERSRGYSNLLKAAAAFGLEARALAPRAADV